MKYDGVRDWMPNEEVQTFALLDKVNISPLFKNHMTPYELMCAIKQKVESQPDSEVYKEVHNNPIYYGELFNWVPEPEFMEYIEDRYGHRWEETITYRLV